jgi:large subunit ribosomal protein L28
MARICQISGTKISFGNNVSHSKRRTSRSWLPNLVKTKVVVNGQTKTLKVSARTLRTLTKKLKAAQA